MGMLNVAWSLVFCGAFYFWLSKFIQAAKLVKAHLAHWSVLAGTTPFESAASSSSTKDSQFVLAHPEVGRGHEIEGVATPSAHWAWSY